MISGRSAWFSIRCGDSKLSPTTFPSGKTTVSRVSAFFPSVLHAASICADGGEQGTDAFLGQPGAGEQVVPGAVNVKFPQRRRGVPRHAPNRDQRNQQEGRVNLPKQASFAHESPSRSHLCAVNRPKQGTVIWPARQTIISIVPFFALCRKTRLARSNTSPKRQRGPLTSRFPRWRVGLACGFPTNPSRNSRRRATGPLV